MYACMCACIYAYMAIYHLCIVDVPLDKYAMDGAELVNYCITTLPNRIEVHHNLPGPALH